MTRRLLLLYPWDELRQAADRVQFHNSHEISCGTGDVFLRKLADHVEKKYKDGERLTTNELLGWIANHVWDFS